MCRVLLLLASLSFLSACGIPIITEINLFHPVEPETPLASEESIYFYRIERRGYSGYRFTDDVPLPFWEYYPIETWSMPGDNGPVRGMAYTGTVDDALWVERKGIKPRAFLGIQFNNGVFLKSPVRTSASPSERHHFVPIPGKANCIGSFIYHFNNRQWKEVYKNDCENLSKQFAKEYPQFANDIVVNTPKWGFVEGMQANLPADPLHIEINPSLKDQPKGFIR